MELLKIGVLVADEDEYVNFEKKFKELGATEIKGIFRKEHKLVLKNSVITAVCFGIGKVNAATAAAYLCFNGADILVNYGYSGGISGVSKGDVMVCDSFLEHDFDLTAIGYKPCQKPGQDYIYSADSRVLKLCKELFGNIPFGRAVCGDSFISSDIKRSEMKNNFGAMSCDMETAAIASVCHQTNVPFLSIREISDDASDDASSLYKETVQKQEMAMLDMVFAVTDYLNEKFIKE